MIKNAKIITITIIYLILLSVFWKTVSADESYVASKKALSETNIELALEQANKSIDKNPNEPRYYYNRAKIYIATNNKSDKQRALTDLKKAEELNPENLVTLRNIIPIYYILITSIDEQDNTYPVFNNLVKNYYTKMNNYTVSDVGLYALLYKYENKMGYTELATQAEEMINKLRPDLFDWYID